MSVSGRKLLVAPKWPDQPFTAARAAPAMNLSWKIT